MKSSPSRGQTHLSQHCYSAAGFLWTFMFLYVPARLPVAPGFLRKSVLIVSCYK